jgi:hypothetical protein
MLRGLRVITLALIALVLMSTEALAIGGYCVSMNTTSCKFCGSLANCQKIFGTAPTFRCTTSAATTCYKCSVNVESLLGGLGNVSQGPNADVVLYRVTMFMQDVHVSCVNKAGNAEPANGQPFINLAVDVSEEDLIDAAQVTKNGRALSDILFEDHEIIATLIAADAFDESITSAADLCQKNWTPRVLIRKMQVFGQVFNNSELADAMAVQCFAPAGAVANEFFTYVGSDFAPPCDLLCSNKLENQNSGIPSCPPEPQVLPVSLP